MSTAPLSRTAQSAARSAERAPGYELDQPGTVAAAVSSHFLRRLLVAIVLIVGMAKVAGDRSTPGQERSDRSPAGIALMAPGWSGTDAVIPERPRTVVAPALEPVLRIGASLSIGGVATMAVAIGVAAQGRSRRFRGSALPLALRARPLPRRAPPVLSLG